MSNALQTAPLPSTDVFPAPGGFTLQIWAGGRTTEGACLRKPIKPIKAKVAVLAICFALGMDVA